MKKRILLILLLSLFLLPFPSFADITDFVIDNADTVASYTSSDTGNTPISQETTIKQEGTGSVKIITTAASNVTADLMEYSSNAIAQAAYVTNSVIASGGTETTSGVYRIHTFTADGTLTFTNAGVVEALLIGGGGGGGGGALVHGGGGGGGFVYNSAFTVSTAGAKTIDVGAGGPSETVGSNSTFDSLVAYGGGKGSDNCVAGGNGGNGGGGAGWNCATIAGGTGSQSYNGGGCLNLQFAGGGGGGAGGAGVTGGTGSWYGGAGGVGASSSISGASVCYAGGGGGSGRSGGIYNASGGGCGGANGGGANAGTNGLGGGGGGGAQSAAGGAGGSGIIIVRYPDLTLQSYSEATIKTQGTYSLKGVAKATNSINKTLTRTIGSPLNLSDINTATFDIRSTRTGSNIKVGLHDSGGVTSEITPNITSANAFQTVTVDLSGVTNANKDVIDSLIITIVNADAENTFYLDNFVSIATSLNNTVTLSRSAVNLSADTMITFWARSSLTGQTMRFQFGESSSSEQTFDFTINQANTWEQKTMDISGIAAASRDAATQFAFKVTSATSGQTFYFDDLQKARPNFAPYTPTLDSPSDGVQELSNTPTLYTTATDFHSDYLMYKIVLCTDSAMTQNCRTYDQTANQIGWTGKNTQSSTAYTSGTQGVYIVQAGAPLLAGTRYYWKSYAKDPGASNTWSSTQTTPYSFKTGLAAYSHPYCTFSGGGIPGQPTGDVVIGASCVIYENLNGTINGNLTIPAGVTVTLHRTLVFSNGYQIDIEDTGLVYINTGGSIVQGNICVKDADNDHYADTVSVTTDPYGISASSPILQIDQVLADAVSGLCDSGYNFRESMNNLTLADTDPATTNTAKTATSDRELLRLGFVVGGVTDANAVDNPVKITGDNLLVCQAAGCPSVSFGTTDGNAYVSQRVGIGKTNPAYPLDVNGTLNATALYVGGSPYIGSHWTTVNTTEIYYATGNVGVGTTDPVKELDVVGSLALHPSGTAADTQYFGSLMITKPTTSGQYINLVRSGTSGWSIGTVYNNSNFGIGPINGTDSNFVPSFVITSAGNVGIGITNPTYKLQVAGSLYVSGSSRDYKENIVPLVPDPNKIYQLNPVTYDYKQQYKELGKTLSGGRQFGLIAEDVYNVYPELTLSDGTRNIANVDYEKLSVLLLAEMQNQKTEIDSIKLKINSLKQRLILLKSKLR